MHSLLKKPPSFSLIILLLSLNGMVVSGQQRNSENIDESAIESWKVASRQSYTGQYAFGEGEAESTISIFFTDGYDLAQIRRSAWSDKLNNWVSEYEYIEDMEVSMDGKLIGKQYIGEFVRYHQDGEMLNCLKIFDTRIKVSDETPYELGCRISKKKPNFPGKYPQASLESLDIATLKKIDREELRIMRNEIFARYGYQFREGGEMDQYFQKQDWYFATHEDVTGFLSPLEKANIKRIQEIEASK